MQASLREQQKQYNTEVMQLEESNNGLNQYNVQLLKDNQIFKSQMENLNKQISINKNVIEAYSKANQED